MGIGAPPNDRLAATGRVNAGQSNPAVRRYNNHLTGYSGLLVAILGYNRLYHLSRDAQTEIKDLWEQEH